MVERLITLCGPPGAGKGTTRRIIETLVPESKRLVVSTSDIIRDELIKQGVTNFNDRKAKQEAFVRIATTEGEEWLINRVSRAFRLSDKMVGILDAVCMPMDIKWLQTLPKYKWVPLYIEAPFRTRRERRRAASQRGETDSKPDEADMNEDDFIEMLMHETAIHIPSFRNIPGTAIIRHDSTIENLGRQIISVLRERLILNDSDYLIGSRVLLRFYDDFNRKIANRRLQT